MGRPEARSVRETPFGHSVHERRPRKVRQQRPRDRRHLRALRREALAALLPARQPDATTPPWFAQEHMRALAPVMRRLASVHRERLPSDADSRQARTS
ncbi:hypothetical protein [Streptomyces sp. NPDC002690]